MSFLACRYKQNCSYYYCYNSYD